MLALLSLKSLVCSLIFKVFVMFISHATVISVGLVYLVLTPLFKIPSAAAFRRLDRTKRRDWEFIIRFYL